LASVSTTARSSERDAADIALLCAGITSARWSCARTAASTASYPPFATMYARIIASASGSRALASFVLMFFSSIEMLTSL